MRTAITLLDPLGYSFYADEDGNSYFPADEYDVRLVTDLDKIPEASGSAITSVVGIQRFDQSTLREAALFASRSGGVKSERMVALTERLLLPCAELRTELGIPGDGVQDILPFRDKVRMKEHLHQRGVRVPRFAPYSRSAAEDLLRKFEKVAVKPVRESESIGFSAISEVAELASFETQCATSLADMEVEEFISGRLFHIDSVVDRTRVIAVSAGHSPEPNASYKGQNHYCDVEVPPGLLFDRLEEFNQRVLNCYPNYSGVTHLEVFVTADEIVFCEIAARFGGGGIRAGFRARTGIDLAYAMVAAQLGRTMPESTRLSTGSISGFTAVAAPDRPLMRPIVLSAPWIIEKHVFAQPGKYQRARLAAVVTVRGENEEQVYDRLRQVQTAVCEAFETGGTNRAT